MGRDSDNTNLQDRAGVLLDYGKIFLKAVFSRAIRHPIDGSYQIIRYPSAVRDLLAVGYRLPKYHWHWFPLDVYAAATYGRDGLLLCRQEREEGYNFDTRSLCDACEVAGLEEVTRLVDKGWPLKKLHGGYGSGLISIMGKISEEETDRAIEWFREREAGSDDPLMFLPTIYSYIDRIDDAMSADTADQTGRLVFRGEVTDVAFRGNTKAFARIFGVSEWTAENIAGGVVQVDYCAKPEILGVFIDFLKNHYKIDSIDGI